MSARPATGLRELPPRSLSPFQLLIPISNRQTNSEPDFERMARRTALQRQDGDNRELKLRTSTSARLAVALLVGALYINGNRYKVHYYIRSRWAVTYCKELPAVCLLAST